MVEKDNYITDIDLENVDENTPIIIVQGKTGTGKSSILNSLVNGKNEKDHSKDKFKEGGDYNSTTKNIICKYLNLFYDNSGKKYLLIDFPGFYDSDNQDIKNIKLAVEFFKKIRNSNGINLILFPFSLTESKVDDTLYTSLEALQLLLGKDIIQHLTFVFTHKNELKENSYQKRLENLKSLKSILYRKHFYVNIPDNVQDFLIYDYDDPEEFCMSIIHLAQKSIKFTPIYLENFGPILDIDFTNRFQALIQILDILNKNKVESQELKKLYNEMIKKNEQLEKERFYCIIF